MIEMIPVMQYSRKSKSGTVPPKVGRLAGLNTTRTVIFVCGVFNARHLHDTGIIMC